MDELTDQLMNFLVYQVYIIISYNLGLPVYQVYQVYQGFTRVYQFTTLHTGRNKVKSMFETKVNMIINNTIQYESYYRAADLARLEHARMRGFA